jgi:hypothetical protein
MAGETTWPGSGNAFRGHQRFAPAAAGRWQKPHEGAVPAGTSPAGPGPVAEPSLLVIDPSPSAGTTRIGFPRVRPGG